MTNTYSILEAKQQDLQLTDGGTVEVQLQLELRQRVGDDLPVRHANKVGQADHEGGDVLMLQLHFFRALEVTGRRGTWGQEPEPEKLRCTGGTRSRDA